MDLDARINDSKWYQGFLLNTESKQERLYKNTKPAKQCDVKMHVLILAERFFSIAFFTEGWKSCIEIIMDTKNFRLSQSFPLFENLLTRSALSVS